MKLHIAPLLAEKRITQTAFADAIGVNKSYVSEMVAGKKEPSFDTLRKMVEVLGVPVGQLFGEEPVDALAATPPGFSESQAEPFEFRASGPLGMQARMFQAMKTGARHPTAYRLTRHIPSLAMRSQDVLVVDLATRAREGQVILVGMTDRQGYNAITLVRRLVGPYAMSAELDDQEPAIHLEDDPRAAWRGTVKGLIRDTV
jgi:transcriptional regulator with XRE-family HTH domain